MPPCGSSTRDGPSLPADPAAGVKAPVRARRRLRSATTSWRGTRTSSASFTGRSVLLSHHQLYSAVQACGVPPGATPGDLNREWVNTALWKQLGADFETRSRPGSGATSTISGIFQDGYRPSDWPADAATTSSPLPKGRCAGHAAIPGAARARARTPTKYPVPLVSDDVKLAVTDGWYNRGFEILELKGAGKPARFATSRWRTSTPIRYPSTTKP